MTSSPSTRSGVTSRLAVGVALGLVQAVAFIPLLWILVNPVGRLWPSHIRAEDMGAGLGLLLLLVVFTIGGVAWRVDDELAPGSRYRWITRGAVLLALGRILMMMYDPWPPLVPVAVVSLIGAAAVTSAGRPLLRRLRKVVSRSPRDASYSHQA